MPSSVTNGSRSCSREIFELTSARCGCGSSTPRQLPFASAWSERQDPNPRVHWNPPAAWSSPMRSAAAPGWVPPAIALGPSTTRTGVRHSPRERIGPGRRRLPAQLAHAARRRCRHSRAHPNYAAPRSRVDAIVALLQSGRFRCWNDQVRKPQLRRSGGSVNGGARSPTRASSRPNPTDHEVADGVMYQFGIHDSRLSDDPGPGRRL